jgi:hypothetical protein
MKALKYYGYKETAILSGGSPVFGKYLHPKRLGIDYVHADELEL